MNAEKRSPSPAHEPSDLFGTPSPAPLGGRQGDRPQPLGGGGSPDECSGSNAAVRRVAPAATDPRIEQLRRMGLGRPWAAVARTIGFDAFVAAWRVLDSMPEVLDERHRVCVPAFSTFLRFQRNQVIRDMHTRGHSNAQIAQHLRQRLGETISDYHIARVLKNLDA
jgi:hypothetical protein